MLRRPLLFLSSCVSNTNGLEWIESLFSNKKTVGIFPSLFLRLIYAILPIMLRHHNNYLFTQAFPGKQHELLTAKSCSSRASSGFGTLCGFFLTFLSLSYTFCHFHSEGLYQNILKHLRIKLVNFILVKTPKIFES